MIKNIVFRDIFLYELFFSFFFFCNVYQLWSKNLLFTVNWTEINARSRDFYKYDI